MMIHVESRHVYTLVSRGYDTPGRSVIRDASVDVEHHRDDADVIREFASPRPPRERAPRPPSRPIFSSKPRSHRTAATNLRRGAFQRRRDLFVIDGVPHAAARQDERAVPLPHLSRRKSRARQTPRRRHLVSERAREEDAGKPRVSQEEPLGTISASPRVPPRRALVLRRSPDARVPTRGDGRTWSCPRRDDSNGEDGDAAGRRENVTPPRRGRRRQRPSRTATPQQARIPLPRSRAIRARSSSSTPALERIIAPHFDLSEKAL